MLGAGSHRRSGISPRPRPGRRRIAGAPGQSRAHPQLPQDARPARQDRQARRRPDCAPCPDGGPARSSRVTRGRSGHQDPGSAPAPAGRDGGGRAQSSPADDRRRHRREPASQPGRPAGRHPRQPGRARTLQIQLSIPGIGPVAASTPVIGRPELGQVDRHAIASLAGLAPHPQRSGTSQNGHSLRGGRSCVRVALSMAALSASRSRSPFKTASDDLVARGEGRPNRR